MAPATDLSFDFALGLRVWFVPPPASARGGRITGIRQGSKGPMLTIEGIDDVNVAVQLRGADILVRTEDLPANWYDMEDDPDDVIGFDVIDEEHGLLGSVSEIIYTGANDVWVVDGSFGEVLIPVIDDVVLDVDRPERRITVRLLPGLMPGEAYET